jgi:beta-N-acetylhexosaminidase
VIGNRSFHGNPDAVTMLAGALIDGMREAGMGCCGKHFPGHGWAEADSHVAIPQDDRSLAELSADLAPYRRLKLDAVMPAHVIYPQVDSRPAGFSPVWLGMLREQLGFDGVIFSDDLSMEGAAVAGGIAERADAAWSAGCDMLPVCNSPDAVGDLLERWQPQPDPISAGRIARLLPDRLASPWPDLAKQGAYQAGLAVIRRLAGEAPAPGQA